MRPVLTCPQGHRWDRAANDEPELPNGSTACPVCGAAALACPPAATIEALSVPEAATLAPPAPPTLSGPDASAAARAVPGYEILAELGRGGMGVVYQARQIALNRLVALKMILAGGHAAEADLVRFRTEAEAIARLQHPNIVAVYEVGQHDGTPFFSLEFCPGGSLDRKLAGTPMDPQAAARLVQTLAEAMQAAHQANVIHRDLKPANVLLAADGTPKITDFGLAKKLDAASPGLASPGRQSGELTATGAILGTPSYMAPEQAAGTRQVGPAADVYALGAILYECLTGRPPFRAATPLETLRQVLEQEPEPPRKLNPRIDRDLETICLKCLDKELHKRYASAEALAQDLDRFLEGHPISARPLGEWESALRWAKKHPVTAALTVLMVSGTLLVQLFYTALGLSVIGTFGLAFAAGPAGFLATMAILIQPRRWVVFGVVLFLLVTLGLPCMAQVYLKGADQTGPFETLVPGVPNILFVALGLGAGVFLAGLFGGMSRWIAQRCETDLLTVFFAGVVGATCLIILSGCLIQILVMLFLGPNPLRAGGIEGFVIIGAGYLLMFIGSLVGFWLGGTFVARFLGRRLRQGSGT